MSALNADDLSTLNLLRQRLYNLTTSLDNLRFRLEAIDPLPSWSLLQKITSTITFTIERISAHLSEHPALFAALHVYPLPSFPDRAHENVVGQLLRKKLDPEVETWLDDAGATGVQKENLPELWEWAIGCAAELSESVEFGSDFTMAETEGGRENVRHGLKTLHSGESDESDEDGEEDVQKMDVDSKAELVPLPLDDVLKFMSTGAIPR